MIPRCTVGKGITGAVRYVLGEGRDPHTGELKRIPSCARSRVAWIGGIGFGFEIKSDEDVELARRVMEWGAQFQESRTRRCEKDCVHLSLSWQPGDQPMHEQMAEAAQQALTSIGMANARALFAVHSDEPHAHIHIVASKINPATGRAYDLKENYVKLSRWAEAYERMHDGRVLCRNRVKVNRSRLAAGRHAREYSRRRRQPPVKAFQPPPRQEAIALSVPKKRKRRRARKLRERFKSAVAALFVRTENPRSPRKERKKGKSRNRGKTGKGKSGRRKRSGQFSSMARRLFARPPPRKTRGKPPLLKRGRRRSWLLALWRRLASWFSRLFRPAPTRTVYRRRVRDRRPREH